MHFWYAFLVITSCTWAGPARRSYILMGRPKRLTSSPAVPTADKFCVNCQHFIPHSQGVAYGTCRAFPMIDQLVQEGMTRYLVTGYDATNATLTYYYCSTVRNTERFCGRDGKMFQEKKI